MVALKACTVVANDCAYEYFAAISSDTFILLRLVNGEYVPSEWIVEGKDYDAFVCAWDNIDDYLDSICIVKEYISSGRNLLDLL
jgi:hypothetical protein